MRIRVPEGYLGLLFRLVLGVVFSWSGIAKASDRAGTEQSVKAYHLVGESLVVPVADSLPWIELALAVLLLAGMAVRLTAIIAALLFIAFIIGVSSAAARGLLIDCGCFGGGGAVGAGQTHYATEIARDVVFLLISVFLSIRPLSRFSVDSALLQTWRPGSQPAVGDSGADGSLPAVGGSGVDGEQAETFSADRSGPRPGSGTG